MPSKHKHTPISLRLPEADRSWLLAYAEHTGIPVNRILADALAVFRADLATHVAEHGSDTAAPPQKPSLVSTATIPERKD